MRTLSILGLVSWIAAGAAQGQRSPRLELLAQSWTPPPAASAAERQELLDRAAVNAAAGVPRVHVLLQLHEVPGLAGRRALRSDGIDLGPYVPHGAWIASLPVDRAGDLVAGSSVRWFSLWSADRKLHPRISSGDWAPWAKDPERPGWVMTFVQLHHDVALARVVELAEAHGGVPMKPLEGGHGATVWLPEERIGGLADEEDVLWIEEGPPPLSPNNDGVRASTRVDPLQAALPGLDGSGVTLFVYDSGSVRASHSTFDPGSGSRVTDIDATADNDHPTHVAGTAAGDGNGGRARGVADGADILSAGYQQVLGTMLFWDNAGDIEGDYDQARNVFDADLGTNSIGSNTANNNYPCSREGDYGVSSNLLDTIVGGTNATVGSAVIMTWANGNERTGGSPRGRCGSNYLTTAPPSCAKNPIHVGAINSDGESMTTFSSWGPCDDDRLKPVISAPGCETGRVSGENYIFSSLNTGDNAFGGSGWCGTSMATPAVAGIVSLLIQEWRVVTSSGPTARPLPALVKAMLMQTAQDLGQDGPDYIYGYGNADAVALVDLLQSGTPCIGSSCWAEFSVEQGLTVDFSVDVPPDTGELRASLAWDDPAAAAFAAVALVNDLDLELIAPDLTVHRPWVLDGANPHLPATRGINTVDNQEQAVVIDPAPGIWTVRVLGASVPSGPQSFGLAYEAFPASFEPTTCVEEVANGDFETDTAGWTLTGATARTAAPAPGHGSFSLQFGGGDNQTDEATLDLAVPATATRAELSYWWHMTTAEGPGHGFDSFLAEVRDTSNGVIETFDLRNDGWQQGEWMRQENVDLTPWAGQTVRIAFRSITDVTLPTTFWVDDVSLELCDDLPCPPPLPPSGLTASSPLPNQVSLSWSLSPTPGLTDYVIYRSRTAGGPYTLVDTVPAPTTNYLDTGVSGVFTYYYVVRALLGCESADSNEAAVLVGGECLDPPTFGGLDSVEAHNPGGICGARLRWTEGTNHCGSEPLVYNIYRDTSPGFTPGPANLVFDCVAGTTYDDTEIVADTTYHYIVQAEDATLGNGGLCRDGFEDGNVLERSLSIDTQQVLLAEDFDALAAGGVPAGWQIGTFGGTNSWRGARACPTTSPPNVLRYGSAFSCSGNYQPDGDALTITAPMVVPLDALAAEAQFSHRFQFGTDDGGLLYVSSAANFPTFFHVGSAYVFGQTYNSTAKGLASFGGTSPSYNLDAMLDTFVDLSAFCNDNPAFFAGDCAGETLYFGFNGFSDAPGTGDGWFIDDVEIRAIPPGCSFPLPDPEPVQFFTATAGDGQTVLEWLNPSGGTYNATLIIRNTTHFPTTPFDGDLVAVHPDGLGSKGSTVDPLLTNGTTYYYSAFVRASLSFPQHHSARRTVTARPFDTSGAAKWAYSSGATSMAPPAIGSVYAVANDRVLHSMVPGAAGGGWPAPWQPTFSLGTSQSRPSILPVALGGATKVAFLGIQGGVVQAMDADTGATIWSSPQTTQIQAAPAVITTAFGASYDLVLIGSRNSTGPNPFLGIDMFSGFPAWQFDNGGGPDEIGIVTGQAAVDPATNRVYFGSRRRPGGSSNTVWALSFTNASASLLWARDVGEVDGSPTLVGNRLYVGTNDGEVHALDAATGADLWPAPFTTGDGPVKGYVWPRFGTSEILFSTTHQLWSITDNGAGWTLNWSVGSIPNPSIPLVSPFDPMAYAGGSDGRLYQLDISGGAPLITSVVLGDGTAAVGSPTLDVVDGVAYVGSESGQVYAITLPLP